MRKGIEVNDLSNGQYFVNNNKMFKAPMLRSDLCRYIVVKWTINLLAAGAAANENYKAQKYFTFKNNTPISSCILKI